MTLRDKLKSAFHKKSASKDIPQVEIVGSKVPPMSKDPGFRKSFNLGDRGDHGDEDEQGESSSSKNTSRPVSAAVPVPSDTLTVPVAVPVKPGQFQKPAPPTAMFTVDQYEGEYVSVSPRTKSTIPDSSTVGSEGTEVGDIASVPSLDLSGKSAAPIHTMEPIGEGKVLEGASQKLEAINKAGGVDASRGTYTDEKGERDGGTLEPYPTRTSEASAAYGSGAYTAPQRTLVPQATSDGGSSVYSDDLSGSRPGLGIPRDTDASVYSQDEVSGQWTPKMNEEIAKKSGVAEEHVFNEPPGNTVAALKTEEESPDIMLRRPTAHDIEGVPQTEAIHSKSAEEEPVAPTATPQQTGHTSLLTDVLADAHTPSQQKDRFNQPTRFHQPGDFFTAVQSTFPESAPATGNGIVSTVKGDDAESWSKGVIAGIDGVDVKTPREEKSGLSGLLDQATKNVPVASGFTSAGAPAQRDFASYTSRGAEGGFTLAGAGAVVSNVASNAYTTVADTVTGNNETGKTIKEALIPSTTKPQQSAFTELPETAHAKTSGVETFGDLSEKTTEESPLERNATASQPTTYTPPVDSTTEAPAEKSAIASAGIVPTISNAVSNAYNSAAQTITEATASSPTSAPHIPSERDVDLEQGHGSREVTEGSTTTGGITGIVNNLSAAVAPSTETKQWAGDLYNNAAKAVTGNTAEDKQADAFAGILGGHTKPATGAIDPIDKSIAEATHPITTTTNTVPHAPALEHDVPDVGDERPKDVPYGDQPITTSSNSLPVAEFNQATPSTAFGKHDIVRDTKGSQADKAFVDDEFDPSKEVRPKMNHADTMNTIDVVRDMPGGMW